MATASNTSLQRLLALDKTFDSLDDRIEAAAEILGITLSAENQTTSHTGNYGRQDFVFRWISEKLKKDASARANPLAWTLLRQVTSSLPPSKVAKLVANAGLATTVVAGIEEAQNRLTNSSTQTAAPSSTASKKKRKRSEVQDVNQDLHSTTEATFSEIQRLLHSIRLPCTNHQVAEIARSWFKGLIMLLDSQSESKLCGDVQLILDIWNKTSRTSAKQEIEKHFADEVAWAAMALASQAHARSLVSLERVLKQHIRKELLQPSHDSFLRSTFSSSKSASTSNVQGSFAAIMHQVTTSLTSLSNKVTGLKIEDLCNLLGLLFDYCHELKEHHSPREKRAHAKWIEALFLLFSSLWAHSDQSDATVDYPKQLLMAVLSNIPADVLTASVLEDILLNYSGLSVDFKNNIVDFELIARVLALEPSIFTSAQRHKELSLDIILQSIISASRQITKPDNKDAELWVTKLAVPLVNAQLQRQRADAFLKSWSSSVDIYSGVSTDEWWIWQHQDFRVAFSHLIDTAVTLPCLKETLNVVTQDLSSRLSSKATQDGTNRTACDLQKLTILINCVRSDNLITQLQAELGDILKALSSALSGSKAKKVPRTQLWDLLAELYERLYPDFDLSAVPAVTETMAKEALAYLKGNQESDSALPRTVAAALTYILHRKEPSPTTDDGVVDLIESLTAKHSEAVAMALSRSSTTIGLVKSEKAFALHERIIKKLSEHQTLLTRYLEEVVGKAHSLEPAQREKLMKMAPAHASDQAAEDADVAVADEKTKGSKAFRKTMERLVSPQGSVDDAILLKFKTDLNHENPRTRHQLEQEAFGVLSSRVPIHQLARLVCHLLQRSGSDHENSDMALAHILIQSLPSSAPAEPSEQSAGRTVMPALLEKVSSANDQTCTAALGMIRLILQHRRWLINQYFVEMILSTLHKLCSPATPCRTASNCRIIYAEVFRIVQAILRHHRASLGGRLHIVVPVLKQLLACLFVQSKNSTSSMAQFQRTFQQPPWLASADKHPISPQQAKSFSRLITMLCNPPQSTIPGYRASSDQPRLTDVVREARVHISEFVPVLLHAYCHFQLHGVLAEGIRAALTPAVYAIFDVMDMAAPEDQRVIALGASMGKAELALLRKEHGEWKRFGRWKGA